MGMQSHAYGKKNSTRWDKNLNGRGEGRSTLEEHEKSLFSEDEKQGRLAPIHAGMNQ